MIAILPEGNPFVLHLTNSSLNCQQEFSVIVPSCYKVSVESLQILDRSHLQVVSATQMSLGNVVAFGHDQGQVLNQHA